VAVSGFFVAQLSDLEKLLVGVAGISAPRVFGGAWLCSGARMLTAPRAKFGRKRSKKIFLPRV